MIEPLRSHVHAAGIDFGTSNSSVGFCCNGQSGLVDFQGDGHSIPSAIFYSLESDQVAFGKQAVVEYTAETEGRLLRALKSVLGSSLIQEKTLIRNQRIAFTDIICDFFRFLHDSLSHLDDQLAERIVLGRPVQFVDGDSDKDKQAQNQLEKIALQAGFSHVEFQYEPIAAALDYESRLSREQLALIVDIGGGTADFSIIRLSPDRHRVADRSKDILAAMGIHIGGTDLDQLLSMGSVMPHLGLGSLVKNTQRAQPRSVYHDLATWHRIPLLYNHECERRVQTMLVEATEPRKLAALASIIKRRDGHKLAREVEMLKIKLSDHEQARLHLRIANGDELSIVSTRDEFDLAISNALTAMLECVNAGLDAAGVSSAGISSVFYTGGTSSVPLIRNAFESQFPQAAHVSGDAFGSVAKGLTIDAVRRYA
jgi:hypothetical chaperone protein